MRRTIVLASLGVLAFGFISAVVVLFAARVPVVGYFLQNAVKSLKNEGYRVRYESLTSSGLAFTVSDVEVWKGFFSISADEITVRPLIRSVFTMALAATINAKMYGGEAMFSPKVNADETFNLDGTVRNLQLSQHPQILGLGISDGMLGLNLDSFTVRPDQTLALRGRLSLTNLIINPPPLPIPVKMPVIRDGSMELDVESSERETLLSNVSVDSSLASASGEVRFVHDHFRNPTALKVKAQVSITAEGQPFLGPYLPLISNGNLKVESSQFRITIDASRCSPGGTPIFRMGGSPLCGSVSIK